jgi:serine kinase of HPr protein (carbohydrate metabolism regulator)
METVHATCIAFDGVGILLRGPSGSGKSDLALRAIADGARLIADDRVALARAGDRVVASAPESLRGLIEIRGLGIMKMASDDRAPLSLVADLEPRAEIARMPERTCCTLMGAEIDWIALAPFEASASVRLRHALACALRPGILTR